MIRVYPVVFSPAQEGGYDVYVPDFDINTQGNDLPEAIYMARDAIGGMGCFWQDEGKDIPPPSDLARVNPQGDGVVSLVDVDFDAYRRQRDTRTVRKNLTVPSWLNVAAERQGLNFSQVLQQGLKDQLGVQDYR
ncbi:MAG: type II toxin-antitoxin system HicB family antitoxin [Oscillospiraceae bacterium]|jgi:predicted RNase H-like HicB family nuclease|nr:type II toxin-antitoxin system HicB family antitoxin [Oscillospiraceae bacterium]